MRSMSMDHTSEYHCNICGRTFQEFVIFEGHFTFNVKCRAQRGPFMQCYICSEIFFHFAVLKYHLQSHNNNNVIQKIDSTNQDKAPQPHGIDCNICDRSFRTKFHLIEHLQMHSKADATSQPTLNESSKETDSQNVNPTNENPHKQSQADGFNCNICERSFRTKFHLIEHLPMHSKESTANSNQINGSPKENIHRKTVDRCSSNQIDRNKSSDKLQRGYRCQVCNANCYFKTQLGNFRKFILS